MATKGTSMKGDLIVDAPELEPLHLEAKPDGPGAAVMLAAGIGIFLLGLLTLLAEASTGIHDWLGKMEFDKGVGPLAGKTILASLGFFLSWLVLGMVMRTKEVDLRKWFWWSFGVGVAGAILMFPPLFQAFAAE